MSLSQGGLLGIVLGYLVFLFVVATAAEAGSRWLTRGWARTVTYVLAASVYCTAWTFYGSVGLAANRGLEFLTIYLGPACIALLWPVLLRKLVRVAKEQRITSISDFISSRYGKSAPLGMLVALLVVGGMIPYIALQLKAVSVSFTMILREASVLDVFDPTFLVAATLALFGILFGARNLDFTKQQTGLMTAVAVESVVKLVAFLLVGVYVTWGLFGGLGDLFGRAAAHPEWSRLLTLDQPTTASYSRWAAMLVISMMAVMFLPRQFHVLVVQNPHERDVRTVSWSFPLYLLLINLFVLPIALAGLAIFPAAGATADSFILRLPLHFDSHLISVVVFLGGFSAATAMIVVDSLALSKMITNDVILPILLRRRTFEDLYWITLFYTRLAMLGVVALGFMWARMEHGQLLLVEMGLLSFVAVSQCAPAILLGLYWRRGNRRGAFAGISAGFFMWLYTLIIPALGKEGVLRAVVPRRRPLRVRRSAAHRVPRPHRPRSPEPRRVLVALLQPRPLRDRVAAHRAARRRARAGGRLRGDARGGQGRRGRARHPLANRDRAAGPPLRGRGAGAGDHPRAVRRQVARRPVRPRAPRAAHPLRAPPRRPPGRRRRAHDRRGPLHHLQGGGAAAGGLLPPDAGIAQGDGGGGAARRAPARLRRPERGRLHLHRRRRRPPRHHEPGGPAPARLSRAGFSRSRHRRSRWAPRTGAGSGRPSRGRWSRGRAGAGR